MFPEDDRPNSYDVTIDHSAEASVDTPIPYGYSTNPPVNTPPAGSLGPGGFATAEDSQAISDLQGQVAMNGSAAASNNAARDAAFAELAEETESSDDPGDESTTEPPSASSVAATYVNGQGALPMPGNPQVISSTAGAEAAAAGSETRRPGVWGSIKNFLFGNGEPSAAATRAESQRQRNREMQRSGAASLRAEMGLVDQEAAQRSLDAIDAAATVAKEAGSMALDSAPVIGSMKSIEELRTGVDINGNEVSKTQAVLGMGLGLFGLKGAGKGIGKGLSQISDKADDIADTAKAASKASSRVVGGAHESLVQYRIRDSLTPLAGTRQTGINRAWKLEQELVQKTGKGTHNWSPAQAKELLETGSVKGFTGHHINNVDQFPDWAGDPRNIRFLGTKPRGGEHLQSLQGHRGNFQNPTSGRLIDRVEMLRQLGFGG